MSHLGPYCALVPPSGGFSVTAIVTCALSENSVGWSSKKPNNDTNEYVLPSLLKFQRKIGTMIESIEQKHLPGNRS